MRLSMNYRTLLITVGLLCLSGCSYKKYRVKQLASLTEQTAEFCETKENVTVKAKKFTSQDSKDFFYGDGLSFYKRGKHQSIVPIHFTVDNTRTSPIRYIICSKNGLLKDEGVAQLLHISLAGPILTTCAVAVTVGCGMALFGIINTMGRGQFLASASTGNWIEAVILAGGLIALPVFYANYRTKVNALIDEQLRLNRFPETQEISENGSVNGLIYHKSPVDELQVLVYEQNRLITTFDVAC